MAEQFRSLLTNAGRLRVRSDVAIGTMLNGDLDSTSITALMHEQRRLSSPESSRPESKGLHEFHQTFSACWPGWYQDEEEEIDHLCTRLGLLSHKLYPTGETVADLLPRVAYLLDESHETPVAVVQYLLVREVREHGATGGPQSSA